MERFSTRKLLKEHSLTIVRIIRKLAIVIEFSIIGKDVPWLESLKSKIDCKCIKFFSFVHRSSDVPSFSRILSAEKRATLSLKPYSLGPMRASQRIPRTQQIAKQANRVSDQGKKELPTWANFSVLIAGTTVVAFLCSSLFVSSLTIALHFPVAVYIDFADYIKLLPTAVTVTGPFWLQMLLIVTVAAAYKLYILPKWQLTPRPTKFARAIRMFFPFMTLVFKFLPILLVLDLLWCAFLFAGDQTVDGLRHARTLKVFRKGELHPVEGKLICPSSKYVLLLTDQDKSVAIIPQTEIRFIERPWNVPDIHPSPTVSHALPSGSP
jgi:hypothetical protein